MIREKLLKLAIRIPMFMYLTDRREKSLSDVIGHKSQSIIRREPALFKRVTGLDVKDFELLVALKVFNENKMDNAVLGFKRYEDPSLIYAGVDKHKDKQT